MPAIFTGLIGSWVLRRLMELGGIFAAAAVWYAQLTPAQQETIGRVFNGNWQELPLGSVAFLIVTVWGYVWSFRSTVKPQVVVDNKQVPLKSMTAASEMIVAEKARTTIEKKPTLWEKLTGR